LGSYPALDLSFAPGPGAGTLQDMLYAELDAFGPVAIQEHDGGDGWRVFFRSPADRDRARGALSSEFGNALIAVEALEVDDGDWARRSQATLTPIRVGRIIVTPPWHAHDRSSPLAVRGSSTNSEQRTADSDSDRGSQLALRGSAERATNSEQRTANSDFDRGSQVAVRGSSTNSEQRTANSDIDEITIVIDPSTGFGTGHHPSTRLCLELLQKQNLRGARVIDVGTGSGVLALAAWKLGATHVIAIDNDPDALANTRDNVTANGGADAITIEQFDLSSVSLPAADLVAANLTGALLQRHAPVLRTLVAPGGVLIVSGFTVEEQKEVEQALTASVQETASEGEWGALVIARH
jgi:ribosomal protein L11 methylase PrmA